MATCANDDHLVNEEADQTALMRGPDGPHADLPESLTPARAAERVTKDLPLSVAGFARGSPNQVFGAPTSPTCGAASSVGFLYFCRHPLPDRIMRSHDPERVDWHTRKVRRRPYLKHAWKPSSVLNAKFELKAIHTFGHPEHTWN